MSMLRRNWPWIVTFIVLLALPFLFSLLFGFGFIGLDSCHIETSR